MEKVFSKVVALCVPYNMLQIACKASGHKGGAALTSGLSPLGRSFGMMGGCVTLGIVGIATDVLTEKIIDMILIGVVKQLCSEGESQEEIFFKIDKYPVSNELKLKLKEAVRQYNLTAIQE